METKKGNRTSQAIIRELCERSAKCHQYVRTVFLSEKIRHQELRKALRHYFSYWNDFTHPGLFSIAFEACGGRPDEQVESQAAVAMVAAGFDIHDDIIDKSEKKRDHLTVFGNYGQDLSLLLGNAFLTKGFALLGQCSAGLPDEKERQVFAAMERCLFEVGNAHALELGLKGKFNTVPEKYLEILEMKAASIEADMQIAALIGRGTDGEVGALSKCGRNLGILATLREEFSDMFELEELERRIRSEALPIPVMFALQEPKSKTPIQRLLGKKRLTSRDIERLLGIVLETKSVEKLRRKMKRLSVETVELSSMMKIEEPKALLKSIAQSMLEDV